MTYLGIIFERQINCKNKNHNIEALVQVANDRLDPTIASPGSAGVQEAALSGSASLSLPL